MSEISRKYQGGSRESEGASKKARGKEGTNSAISQPNSESVRQGAPIDKHGPS